MKEEQHNPWKETLEDGKIKRENRVHAGADKFNKICSKFDCDMDLQSGKYYVDAKSIMGIFSLDLSQPLVLNADTDDEQKVKEAFAEFVQEA